MSENKLQVGTSEYSRVKIGEYVYTGKVSCRLSGRSGLSVNWGSRRDSRGVSIIPFTSFMITSVTDSQLKNGITYELKGENVGHYHKSIDPREPPENEALVCVKVTISYTKTEVKITLSASGLANFKVDINVTLSGQELSTFIDSCNSHFADRLRENALA